LLRLDVKGAFLEVHGEALQPFGLGLVVRGGSDGGVRPPLDEEEDEKGREEDEVQPVEDTRTGALPGRLGETEVE
jgi:hypothetical protein